MLSLAHMKPRHAANAKQKPPIQKEYFEEKETYGRQLIIAFPHPRASGFSTLPNSISPLVYKIEGGIEF